MYIDFYEVLSEVFKLIFFIYKVNKMRIKFVRILWNFVWYLKYFVDIIVLIVFFILFFV